MSPPLPATPFSAPIDVFGHPHAFSMRPSPDRSRKGEAVFWAASVGFLVGLWSFLFGDSDSRFFQAFLVLAAAYAAFVVVHRPEGADRGRWDSEAVGHAVSGIPREAFRAAHDAALRLVAGGPPTNGTDLPDVLGTSWRVQILWNIGARPDGGIGLAPHKIHVVGEEGCAVLWDVSAIPTVPLTRPRHGRHLGALAWEEMPRAMHRLASVCGPFPALDTAHTRLAFAGMAAGAHATAP